MIRNDKHKKLLIPVILFQLITVTKIDADQFYYYNI